MSISHTITPSFTRLPISHTITFVKNRSENKIAATIRYGVSSDCTDKEGFSGDAVIRAEGAGALPNGRRAPVLLKESRGHKNDLPQGEVDFMN